MAVGNTPSTETRGRRLLQPDEAAEYLGIERWKLYELARNGVLASIKVHRTIRFDPADLDAFIASHRRPAITVERV